MKRTTKKAMIEVAKQEIRLWRNLPPGLAMIVLFCFIHRFTEGETVEETFFRDGEPELDYQI